MPKRATNTVPENLPEEMLDQLAPVKSLKFYPRFVYLLDELAARWTEAAREEGRSEEFNRSAAVRRALDEFAAAPHEPLNWLSARPKYPRVKKRAEARGEKPVRERPFVEAPEAPIEQIPFKPYITYRQTQALDRWAAEFKSNHTYLMYQAIWDATERYGIQPPGTDINLRAPEDWSPTQGSHVQ